MVKWWYRVLTAFAGLRRPSARAVTAPPDDVEDTARADTVASGFAPRHNWRAHGSGRH